MAEDGLYADLFTMQVKAFGLGNEDPVEPKELPATETETVPSRDHAQAPSLGGLC